MLSNSNDGGSDFELPGEILSVLPTDPYEQLDLARKITSIAVGTRVSKLEAEAAKLKQKINEKDQIIQGLHEKIAHLEQQVNDTNEQLAYSQEDQAKLTHEKNVLAATVKKLNRDVAKLETFKKTLMQSLQEEDETSQAESTQSRVTKRPAKPSSSLSSKDDDGSVLNGGANLVSNAFLQLGSSVAEDENLAEAHGSRWGSSKSLSLKMPNITPPQTTPTGSPKRVSPAHSPTRRSTESLGRLSPSHSPQRHSASVSPSRRHLISPTRRQLEGRASHSSSLPSSHLATAPNSPPHSGTHSVRSQRMDGKEFFRQARSRLSFEQFSAFLANIKELNSHRQTREETLHKADEIFGPDNKDLYVIFDSLLSRHLA